MQSGYQEDDLYSSPGKSLSGSFRKTRSGFSQNDVDSSPAQSLDGSFRESNSVISAHTTSGFSVSSKFTPRSKRAFKGIKRNGRKLDDLEKFTHTLEDWVRENSQPTGKQSFRSPFSIDEVRKFDLAVEGVMFQQLSRMPISPYPSNDLKENEFLGLQDFLHAVINGLWRTFWHKRRPLPFLISCTRYPGSKFCSIETAISRGMLHELSGFALISKMGSDLKSNWGQVAVLALFCPEITSGSESFLSSSSICRALFYGVHLLISRSSSNSNSIGIGTDSVFVLVFDSKFGGLVKLDGDIRKLELDSSNPYQSVAEWINYHADVSVSPVDRIWNKLGNANWGDLGTRQILLATFLSIVNCNGPPRKSIASLALENSFRHEKRRMECTENTIVPFQNYNHRQGEIVEVDAINDPSFAIHASRLKLRRGELLLIEDQQHGQKSFQIQDSSIGGCYFLYTAISIENPRELLSLYVGAHPSRLEPSWEDMGLWYQVQRQTKILNILKKQGIFSNHLPELVAAGKILHSGPCKKQSPGGRCDHPCCGTPILVTSPIGEPLASIVSRNGTFSSEEALRCCRDCLSALRDAAMVNIQHGDICPENILCRSSNNRIVYVLISWGRAVLEDRDSPAINLQFSSFHALQHGKLCPSSDTESLVYLLYFICGGTMQVQDSIESALKWKERSWAKRTIQQRLGEISPLLKAFADYVDSLCGTPYSADYDIWLNRLNRAVDGHTERGKSIDEMALALRLEDVPESSGTSVAGT